MPFNKEVAKKRLFEKLPPSFADPVTGHQPTNEKELSALLAFFHQRRSVAWNNVRLYLTDNSPSDKMADALLAEGVMLCEYPLFAKTRSEIDTWGAMPADLLYLANNNTTVALFENKIGSEFTSGKDDVDHGQLARQAEYLLQNKILNRYLILLSTRDFFNAGRYMNVLQETLSHKNRQARITGYLMHWEEVLSAIEQ